ncbi:MAG: RidA family protein [Bacteroidales bacterium]|nr:RidA family protein [Bacteroidales bacterium]
MKRIIATPNAPKAIGPYSQAVEANGILYISGQIPVNPATGLVANNIQDQTKQVMENISAIIKEAGYSMTDIVKCTCLLSDISNFKPFNEVYAQYFTGDCPARAAFGGLNLPMGVMIEVEAIAIK